MRRARLVVTAAVTLFCGAGLLSARQLIVSTSGDMSRSAVPAPRGTGLVMGRVVDGDSNEAIPDATVSLSSSAPPASWEPVVTDAQGRFVIRDLPKAMVRFYVVKPGYVPGAYTKRLPVGLDDAGQLLGLGDDERIGDITIKVWKYAVIEGNVSDESGDPVVGITIRALPRRVVGGRTMFAMETGALPFGAFTAQTDDRGLYRLSQLPPSDYIVALPAIVTSAAKNDRVAATSPAKDGVSTSNAALMSWLGGGRSGGTGSPQLEAGDDRFGIVDSRGLVGAPGIAGLTPDGRLLVYETQFFPGTAAMSRATPISVGSGANRSGVDFRLRPVPSFKIAGTATRPEGPAAGLTMRLVSAEMSVTSSDPEVAITTTDSSGRFVFLGVTPGQYAIRALDVPRPTRATTPSTSSTVRTGGGGVTTMISSSGSSAIPDEPTLWTDTAVSVGDRDVAGIAVVMRPGFRVTGRVEFDGSAERPDLSSRPPSVTVARADGQRQSNLTLLFGRIDPTGRFATYGQVPGQYVLQVSAQLHWYLAGIFVGARDVSVLPLDLSKDVDDVVIRFTDRPLASISGTITNGRGQPEENAAAIVFPADRQLWTNTGPTPRNLRALGTGRGGQFTFEGLPAGDYLVAPVPQLSAAWADPKSLDALVPVATRVTVRDLESTSVSLRLGAARTDTDEQVPGPGGPFVPDERQTVRDTTAPVAPGTGRVAGMVAIEGKASVPAAHAHVTLLGTAAFGSRTIITTENGRFDFGQLPAGRYSLAVVKASYLSANYGEKKITGQGTPIVLADGQQLTGITLALHKGGVITGVVRDERGAPMPDAQVSMLLYRTAVDGERRLGSAGANGSLRTDDRGVYRAYGLGPGEYYVSATVSYSAPNAHPISAADIQSAQQALQRGAGTQGSAGPGASTATARSTPANDRHVTVRYAAVLYPGVTTTDGALPVTVGVGEERAGIDFSIRLVPTVRVEGTVTNPAGPLPANVDVRLLSVGDGIPTTGIFNIDTLLPVRPGPDGRFSFQGVAPGAYVVAAMTQSTSGREAAAAATSGHWGITSIDVNGVDLSNVAVALQPGMAVSGKVRFNATTLTPPDLTTVRISLSAVLTSSQVAMGQTSVSPGADGAFMLAGLTPGSYNLRASVPSWLMSAVTIAGNDVIDGPFEIKPGENITDASITLSDRPAEVSGVLQGASGRSATDYYVILMPADPAKWKSPNRRVIPVKPSNDGRFTFRSLIPGDYLIGATTDYEPGAPPDPAVLTDVAKVALKVTLAEGEKKALDLKIGAPIAVSLSTRR